MYKFPIKLDNLSLSYCSQEIGRIGTSIWSIRPLWRPSNWHELTAVEVFRSDRDGIFGIELILSPCDYRRQHLFKTTLPHNQQAQKILTNLKLANGDKAFLGHILIYSSLNCKNDRQSVVSTKSSPSKLSDDLLHLLDNPNSFPDATLKCGTAEIRVHRSILSARSPVLAAMFSSQMQEGLSSTANITDIQLDALQTTLRYIYSGKTDSLTDTMAGDVLFAADKYQLDELKSVCINKLKSSLTADNVFCILVLGELHDICLKAHAMDFLCQSKRFSEMDETEDWKSLEKEYPNLAMEVMRAIITFLRKSCT